MLCEGEFETQPNVLFLRRAMDFYLPPTFPASGIPWERVIPPLIPRTFGTYPSELLLPAAEKTGTAQVNCDHNGFVVQVDVKLFNPEELMVRVTGHFVEVQGKHEEKKDGAGMVTRQFNRRYRIPDGVDTMALESAVSPDGVLIISAPLLQGEESRPLANSQP
ncbi:heat shock protein beta-6 isoform X1 [Osmerus mordax]|uniref:heat shock protein beta-6 isoform X1 n=2 Tax=Osmerus mordax TaxID=8014 RepID=UPI0035102298